MVAMLGSVGTSYGRAQTLTLEMADDSGFHPFGPQESNIGPFEVSVVGAQTGQQPAPFQYYKWSLTITKTSAALPAYTLPSEVSDGDLQIGTVTGLRYPINWCNAQIDYRVSTTLTQDGTAHYVDRGAAADQYKTSLVLAQSENKMAALMEYIVGTARASAFTIVSHTGTYPFGYAKGDGTFSVSLAQSEIDLTHVHPNVWQTTIDLAYNSTPT